MPYKTCTVLLVDLSTIRRRCSVYFNLSFLFIILTKHQTDGVLGEIKKNRSSPDKTESGVVQGVIQPK